jgi:uncharacterized damage-inducible protein DinB
MHFNLTLALQILSTTPRVLVAMLDGVSDAWTRAAYGPGTFSPFDVLGHLIDGEREDWMPRLDIILNDGPGRVFAPFDHGAKGRPEDGDTVGARLSTFATLRNANLTALMALNPTERQLDMEGTHPALGRVTARNLLATWVVHDIHHRAQICKAMAWQYKDEVGPWRGYINTLPKA